MIFGRVLKRAQAGDQDAFSMLYTEYATPLFSVYLLSIAKKEDAEDILRTVFLKAYKALPSHFRDLGRASPLTFFLHHCAAIRSSTSAKETGKYSLIRRHHRWKRFPTIQTWQTISLRASDAAGIHDAMTLPTDDQRDAITLKYMNDLSNMEIAHVLQKEETAIPTATEQGTTGIAVNY